MTRVLRIVREDDGYAICAIEADRETETYGVRSQIPQKFRTPLEAVMAVELTGMSCPPESLATRLCSECLDSYAKRGEITKWDALYAIAALDDDILPLDEDVPDLLGEFLEKRHVAR